MHKTRASPCQAGRRKARQCGDIGRDQPWRRRGPENRRIRRKTARLAARLRREITGDVLFDAFSRGRYATDASFYQIMPAGVVVPRTMDEALRALAIAARRGPNRHPARRRHLAMRPDHQRRHRHRFLEAPEPHRLARRREPNLRGRAGHRARRPQPATQEARPVVSGRRLHRLARHHRRHGRQQFLRRASLRYGTMRDNTLSMEAALADGTLLHFGEVPRDLAASNAQATAGSRCFATCSTLGEREAAEIAATISKGAAPGRRLQSRCAGAAQCAATTWRICWSARRARSPSRRRSS